MSKKFILIGHKKRHGKDTFALMLNKHLPNSRIFSFAYPMKDIMATAKGMTIAEYDHEKNTKPHVRRELQSFGNDKMKEYFGKDVWVKLLINRANKCEEEFIIVSDFRFPVEQIKDSTTIKIHRSSVESDDMHESETALDNFEFDYYVSNDSDLFSLEDSAATIAGYISENSK